MSTKDFLCGNTVKVRWINSGTTPSSISAVAYTGSDTLIDSGAMVSSGAGLYYHWHSVPNTPGYYVVETQALISGKTFKNRFQYRAVLKDVN